MPAAPAAASLLGRYRAELEAAEGALRAALEDAAQSAGRIREVETELRRIWEASYGSPPPEVQGHLDRLRSERAALSERKFEAQRAAEAASLEVARIRRALQATEERARKIRRQLVQETDALLTVERSVAAAEQAVRRLREELRAKELLVAGLRDELHRLTGERG
jgi:chromosome segregation ATPase